MRLVTLSLSLSLSLTLPLTSLIALGASVCGGLGCLLRYCGRRRWRRRQVRNDAAREAILVYQPGGWRESTTTG